ncbi:hypothetical protein [Streptomyces sp. KL118A]|nr:hypothetical protein [Streptomyces sp. KL118A]
MNTEIRPAAEHAPLRALLHAPPHVLPHVLLNHPFHRGSWKHL